MSVATGSSAFADDDGNRDLDVMKSFDVCQCGAPLQLMERPTPTPSGSEVLLKVLAAGVCHSDLHISDGYFDLGGGKRLSIADRGIKLPLTMGHESVGEVVAVGPEARGVKIGDRRLVHPWMGCGECAVCKRGDEQLCLTPSSLGVFRAGGYSDHVMVPHPRYLFDIGDLPPANAAPLACSGITTYGALKKVGPVLRSEPVVIIGAGGLGLMCLALHTAMGGHSAVVVDIDPAKREAASKAGARALIDSGAPDAVEQIKAATKGGAWAVIDLVGSDKTVRLGIDSLIKGGKLVLVGLYGGELMLSLPPFPMRSIALQGSYTGSLTEMSELIDLVRRTGVPPVPVATRPLADVNAALADLRAGKVVGRVVLTPN
jgi:alcohol dehydrogenase, propanol-preferring